MIPTRIYVRSVMEVLKIADVKAMAHITRRYPRNLKRVLPPGLEAHIALFSLDSSADIRAAVRIGTG